MRSTLPALLLLLLLTAATPVMATEDDYASSDQDNLVQVGEEESTDPTAEELEAQARDAEIVEAQARAKALARANPKVNRLALVNQTEPIPLYSNAKIEAFIKMYSVRKRDQFELGIQRSAKYMNMIDRIFAEYNLPPNLAYLAVVESNFNPQARSHANAVGMWQFMSGTGRVFDLETSWWHDERYDPEKSTEAAARYLTRLYNEFGEWELALASYNAGEGKVRRAQVKARTRNHDSSFWSLELPRETRGYVPSFFAVNILFSNLESYGFEPAPDWEAEQMKEYLSVPGGVSLQAVATALQLEHGILAQLNPALPHGLTPANQEEYRIAVPPNTPYDPRVLENLEKDRTRFWRYHVVRYGDTLWSISRRYGVSMSQLTAFNNLSLRRTLRIGQKIMLPAPEEKRPSSKAKFTYHKVQAGETLWSISQKYNVSLDLIKSWNQSLTHLRVLKAGSLVAVKSGS